MTTARKTSWRAEAGMPWARTALECMEGLWTWWYYAVDMYSHWHAIGNFDSKNFECSASCNAQAEVTVGSSTLVLLVSKMTSTVHCFSTINCQVVEFSSSSMVWVWELLAGMTMYVSSAYLHNKLPGVMAFKSAASTNIAGPIAEPWIMLAVTSRT